MGRRRMLRAVACLVTLRHPPLEPIRGVPSRGPRNRAMHKPVLAAAVLLLCGCTLGPDFKPPEAAAPETWTGASAKPAASMPVAAPIDPNWWSLFQDNELTTLEEHVATENLDV